MLPSEKKIAHQSRETSTLRQIQYLTRRQHDLSFETMKYYSTTQNICSRFASFSFVIYNTENGGICVFHFFQYFYEDRTLVTLTTGIPRKTIFILKRALVTDTLPSWTQSRRHGLCTSVEYAFRVVCCAMRPQRVVSLTFRDLSKIFSRNLCIAEIVLLMRISSWNFVCVPKAKAMLWAHIQSFSLKFFR